jgi:hypothetical protein
MSGWAIALALSIAVPSGLPPIDQSAPDDPITIRGVVRTLESVLRERGVLADSDHVAGQVVLLAKGEQAVTLLSNPASRALFMDERLRERPTEVVGRRVKDLPYFDVVLFRVKDESGIFRIAEYYCDVCAISVRYDQICPCCQGAMYLRYKPED